MEKKAKDRIVWFSATHKNSEEGGDPPAAGSRIATAVTDGDLELLAAGPTLDIGRTVTLAEAEEMLIEFLGEHVGAGAAPLGGVNPHTDRRWLAEHMPDLLAFFHYRNVDLSTIRQLVHQWQPEAAWRAREQPAISDAIAELRHYRAHAFIG